MNEDIKCVRVYLPNENRHDWWSTKSDTENTDEHDDSVGNDQGTVVFTPPGSHIPSHTTTIQPRYTTTVGKRLGENQIDV